MLVKLMIVLNVKFQIKCQSKLYFPYINVLKAQPVIFV